MATTPKKKAAPNNFGSITSNLIGSVTTPTQPQDTPEKDKLTTFHLNGELIKPVGRLVHGLGRKASMRSVINTALAYYMENDPKAKRLANTPTPEEEEGQN